MTHADEFDLLRSPLEGTTLIEAGAGTGKTYTITFLYVRLLLELSGIPCTRGGPDRQETDRPGRAGDSATGEDRRANRTWAADRARTGLAPAGPRDILVVTYTTAAAAELKERLRERLAAVAAACARRMDGQADVPPGPDLDPNDQALAALLAPRDLEPARRILERAVCDFDQAAVHTIHAFCARALSEFAFAGAGRLRSETLSDERDLLAACMDDFWRSRIHAWPAHVCAWLHQEGIHPDSLLDELRPLLSTAALLDTGCIRWPPCQDPAELDTRDLEMLLAAWARERNEILQVIDGCTWKKDGAWLLDARPTWVPDLDQAHPVRGLRALVRLRARQLEGLRAKRPANQPWHGFFDQVEEFCQGLEAAAWHVRRQALEALLQETRRRKQEAGLRSYNDLLVDLGRAIEDHPRLAELLAARYRAGLIDEFQDTDPVQYDIFRRIFRNSPMFLIGDPKQAIYGFRGADVFSYLAARRQQGLRLARLHTNYRSAPALVDTVNALFSHPRPGATHFLIPGIDFRPSHSRASVPLLEAKDQAEAMHVFSFGEMRRQEALEESARLAGQEIVRLLALAAQGQARVGGRPLRPGDICVLVRRHGQADLMRGTLAELGVDALASGGGSVLESSEAADLHLLLAALSRPAEPRLLRSALVTPMLGRGARDLEVLAEDENAWEDLLARFTNYSNIWHERGLSAALSACMEGEGVASRLAGLSQGRRRLTNLYHLIDLLMAQEYAGCREPLALVERLASLRQAPPADGEDELRMDGDQDLVTVMTAHRSKGLEFPVVFCPFVWDSEQLSTRKGMVRYHREDDLSLVVDMAPREEDRQRQDLERLAEEIRLLYVMLTRARARCYLCVGEARSRSTLVASLSPLYPLLFPQALDTMGRAGVLAALKEHAKANGIGEYELVQALLLRGVSHGDPGQGVPPVLADDIPPGQARSWQACPGPRGRVRSFTALERVLDTGGASWDGARDIDALGGAVPAIAVPGKAAPPGTRDLDLFAFPRGARAGTCLHAMLERLDFQDLSSAQDMVEEELLRAGFDPGQWGPVLLRALEGVVRTPLDPALPGLCLAALSRRDRVDEMEFHYRIPAWEAAILRQALEDWDGRAPLLEEGEDHDFMHGFIDLVFRFQGRWYVVDYKSNHLGDSRADYAPEALEAVMREAGYLLQARIYTLCLHRHLAHRLPDYDPARHFGGALYLFLRGMDPSVPGSGVYRVPFGPGGEGSCPGAAPAGEEQPPCPGEES